jgi:hypothetical protein
MKISGSKNLGCGTYSYSISPRDADIRCGDKKLQAPRGAQEASGAPSLDTAIEQFCTDNNRKTVTKGQDVYQRYGMTAWDVPDRNSFWLRGALTCSEQETMSKDECVKALKGGLDKCSSNSGYSHGLAASVGCLDYSIDLSGVTRDDSPPWNQKIGFPPPEDAERTDGGQWEVFCSDRAIKKDTVTFDEAEMNKGIDAFCQNGASIAGFGSEDPLLDNMLKWPANDREQMLIGAILNGESKNNVNAKDKWKPYKDMAWCK